MKALTVRQPWASLIVHGPKVIETRTRRTNVRGRIGIIAGRSLVHASGLPDEDDPAWSVDDDIAGGVLAWEGPKAKPVRAMFSYPDATMQAVSLGKLIGTVELHDCVPIVATAPVADWPKSDLITVHARFAQMNRWGPERYTWRMAEQLHDQLPYGDFSTPGRWAWLLRDPEPSAEPIPMRGALGWQEVTL